MLKQTPEDNPDRERIPKVVALVREFLAEVNLQTGKAENRFNLLQLDQQLVFRPGEQVVRVAFSRVVVCKCAGVLTRGRGQDLRLKEDGRELIYKGALNRRGGSQGDSGELQTFLFDHALLMVKQKSKGEQYKVYRRVRPRCPPLFFPPPRPPRLTVPPPRAADPARAAVRHVQRRRRERHRAAVDEPPGQGAHEARVVRQRRRRRCGPGPGPGRDAVPAGGGQDGERRQGRVLDHVRAPRAEVLPDHALGEHAREPAEVGGEHRAAAGEDARAEHVLRDGGAERGVLRWAQPRELRGAVRCVPVAFSVFFLFFFFFFFFCGYRC